MIFLNLPVVLEGKPQSSRPLLPLDCSEITFLTAQTGNHSSSTSPSPTLSLLSVAQSICMAQTFKHGYLSLLDISANVAAAPNVFMLEKHS